MNRRVAPGARSILWRPNRTLGVAVDAGVEVKAVVTAWRPGTPRYFTSADAIDGGITNALYKTSFMVLRKCPAKDVVWRMGSNSDAGYHGDDQTAHLVKLTNDYYIAIYQCTQHQFAFCLGTGWREKCSYSYIH